MADAKICSTFLQLLQSADFGQFWKSNLLRIILRCSMSFVVEGGLLKSGWSLRQAWNLYHKAYEELIQQIDQDVRKGRLTANEGALLLLDLPCDETSRSISSSSLTASTSLNTVPSMSDSRNVVDHAERVPDIVPPQHSVHSSKHAGVTPHFLRLQQVMGSVCYGFGCFHLLLSLLPAHLIKWLKFLGFEGDVNIGIRALTYCTQTPDCKALLARYFGITVLH